MIRISHRTDDLASRSMQDDAGVSLVEIMVSIVILGVALTGFAATLIRVLSSITASEGSVRGNQVAAQELERGRSLDWDCIGLDSSAAGWSATASGGATMVEMDGACTATDENLPTGQVTLDDITYDIVREVYWEDDASIPGAQNHKRTDVTVSWTYQGVTSTTTATTRRSPTVDEEPIISPTATPTATPGSCAPGEIVSFNVSPQPVEITPSGGTAEDMAAVVVACADVSSVTLSMDGLGTRSLTEGATSNGQTTWSTDFPAGTPNFDPQTYTWTITASGGATDSTEVTFFQNAGLPELLIVGFTLSDNLCVKSNKSELFNATDITVELSGVTGGTEATGTISWTSTNTTVPATYVGTSGSNTLWRTTMPSGTELTGTSTTISASFTRTEDSAVASGAMDPVQTVERTNNANQCS